MTEPGVKQSREFEVAGEGGLIRGRLFGSPSGTTSAPPTLLIHPANGTGRQWEPLIAVLPPDRDYILPDLRGHGESLDHPGPYDFDSHVADMERVLDVLGLTGVRLIGASVGGAIACVMAARRPETVESMVVIGSGLIGPTGASADVPRMIEELGSAGMLNQVLPTCFPTGVDPALLEFAVATSNRGASSEVSLSVWRGVLGMDVTTQAGKVRCPALVLSGALDSTFSPADGRALAAATSGKFVELADTGHLPMIDAPAQVAAVIGAWEASSGARP